MAAAPDILMFLTKTTEVVDVGHDHSASTLYGGPSRCNEYITLCTLIGPIAVQLQAEFERQT